MLVDPNRTNQKVPWPIKTQDNIGDNYGPGEQIKVRCKDARGIYYNFLRRRQGDVFNLIPQYVTVVDPKTDKPVMENGQVKMRLVTAKEQFSQETMELVEVEEPENITTAQMALNIQQDELNGGKRSARR